MAVTIEDGSQVDGSNSYVTRAEYIAYALTLSITIADTSTADDQLIASAIFIDSQEPQLKGYRVNRDQSMAYPRNGLYLDGFVWASDEIPTQTKYAQLNLALDINADIDIYNPDDVDSVVKREKIEGAVEVEYAVTEKGTVTKQSLSNSYMNTLMNNQTMSIPLVMA